MPRQPRLDAPGTLHHVIARGIERRKIFWEERDYEDFVARLEFVVSGSGAEVFAWSLLQNHFHLLIRTGETGLPRIMRRLMTGYAVSFNRRHGRHGYVFQNRYKSIVCEEEVYLLELVRYVHLNPLRARRVKSLEELAQYPWCGHGALVGTADRPWQATEQVLARFGAERAEACSRYESFVADGIKQGRRLDLVGGGLSRSSGGGAEAPRRRRRKDEASIAFDERILGGSEFVQAVLRDTEWESRERLRHKARAVTVEELARLTAEFAGLAPEDLRSGTRRVPVVEARRALAKVAVNELGKPGATIARYLGVATSTVNRQAAGGEMSDLGKRLLEALAGEKQSE